MGITGLYRETPDAAPEGRIDNSPGREPGVCKSAGTSPGGATEITKSKAFRPCRGSWVYKFLPGACAPGYCLIAPPGLRRDRVLLQKLTSITMRLALITAAVWFTLAGLGPRTKVDWIEVKWPPPSNKIERFVNPLFDRYITIVEGEGKWA